MISAGGRLRSRWAAALVVAAAFALLGHPSAGAVILLAWLPPTLAVFALHGRRQADADQLALASAT